MSIDEIKARNYNLDIKNPHAEADSHGDPYKLLATYEVHLEHIAAQRTVLKQELEIALGR